MVHIITGLFFVETEHGNRIYGVKILNHTGSDFRHIKRNHRNKA